MLVGTPAVTSVEGCPFRTAETSGELTVSAAAADGYGWRCGEGIGSE